MFAALHSQSSDAKGFGGAPRFIQQQRYGAILLGITALGLLAFGIYSIAEGCTGASKLRPNRFPDVIPPGFDRKPGPY